MYNLDLTKTFQNLRNNNISKLSLNNDSLIEIPKEIKHLKNLKELDLSNNLISIVPKEVFNLVNLQNIDISENNISSFDLEENQINIYSLYLAKCGLTKLPSGIDHLCNLKFLGLQGNKNLNLEEICEAIKNFEKLETLIITGCKKIKIPENIENLKVIKKKVIAQFMFTEEEIELLRSKGIKL